ncbi:MAG: hypothetical protein HRT38_13125 [Alteromonadaceae bacterium]|nr:hypothetical protein [Alteromonadaceae bacterium]
MSYLFSLVVGNYLEQNLVTAVKIKETFGVHRDWSASTRYQSPPDSWQTLIDLICQYPPTNYS